MHTNEIRCKIMNTLIIYFLLVFFLLSLVVFLISHVQNNEHGKIEKLYYDEDGNHIYYERSLREKLYLCVSILIPVQYDLSEDYSPESINYWKEY